MDLNTSTMKSDPGRSVPIASAMGARPVSASLVTTGAVALRAGSCGASVAADTGGAGFATSAAAVTPALFKNRRRFTDPVFDLAMTLPLSGFGASYTDGGRYGRIARA